MTENTVAVRSRKTGDLGAMPADEFVAMVKKQIDELDLNN